MWVYHENLKHKSLLSCTRNNQFREDNKKFMSYFSIKTSYLIMPFTIKQNKRIKFKGVWNTTTQDTLLGLPTLGRSIVLNDSIKLENKWKEKGRRRRRRNR